MQPKNTPIWAVLSYDQRCMVSASHPNPHRACHAIPPKMSKNINLSPHPSALIESLRSIGYTTETALADVIDNSITASASRITVQFRWEESASWIAIIDDGHGMSADGLTNAMRFGSSSPLKDRDENDLGRFGLGMKTASISQCRQLTVASKHEDTVNVRQWDLDKISKQNSEEWLLSHLSDEDITNDSLLSQLAADYLANKKAGTILVWRQLDTSLIGEHKHRSEVRFNEIMNGARKHLETVFHRFLSPGPGQSSTDMDFNGSDLAAFDPFGPPVNARQELPAEDIIIDRQTINVQPFLLPHHSKVSRAEYKKYGGEAGYLANQGFYIYRNKRLIVKATWFRLIKKEELNKLIRIRVDIPNSLDHLWSINVNKSQVRPPETVRKELRRVIKRIEGAGKMIFKRRATKLHNRTLTPVWKREGMGGKIQYKINEEHPLLSHLLNNVPEEYAQQLKSFLRFIDQSFPFDAYYADVASDDVELEEYDVDEEKTRSACEHVIEALRACGFKPEDIRKQVLRTEIPGATEDLIDEILD